MPSVLYPAIAAVMEGRLDEAVVRRLFAEHGVSPYAVHVKDGKTSVRAKIRGNNRSAGHLRWLVLVDLDREFGCAPELVRNWLPDPAAYLRLRVAVRAVESWLLADGANLGAPLGAIPAAPDSPDDPKAAMLALAARSRHRVVREDMLPAAGSKIKTGPAYNARLIGFVERYWQPAAAASIWPSLRRTRRSLAELIRT